MNQRAAVVHWIFFVFLLALGTFFFFLSEIEVLQGVRGEWHLTFLQELYFPAERELQYLDSIARTVGRTTMIELQLNGGYKAGTDSPCGRAQGLNVWKSGCYPALRAIAAEVATEKLHQSLPQLVFEEIGFRQATFYGKGMRKNITSSLGVYNYDAGFSVPLDYSLEEFQRIIQEAQHLIYTCQNVKNLKACLDTSRPSYWHYSSCSSESFPSEGRIISFCVRSPNHTFLPLGNINTVPWGVQYHFALDFTPTTALATTELDIIYNAEVDAFELHFQRDPTADSYTLYYSDYVALQGETGSVADTFGTIPQEGFLNQHVLFRSMDLQLDAVACTSKGRKEPRQGYLCGEEVILVVVDTSFQELERYIFGVTTSSGGKESEVGIIVMEQKMAKNTEK